MSSAQAADFDDYVARHRHVLRRYATVLSGQTWLADDLVADVLGRAYERWDRIGTMSDPHAYIRRMIVNEYLSWRRRLGRTTPRSEIEPTHALPDGTHDHAERDAMIKRLNALPRKQRAAVVLRFYLDMSDAEIAAELGCREVTVRTQISRALASMRLTLATEPATA